MDQDKAIQDLRNSFEDYKAKQMSYDTDVRHKLDRIIRGLYGDKDNDQAGLIQRQGRDEEQFRLLDYRLEKVENKQYKMWVWGVGALAVIQLLWEWFKSKFV